MSAGTVFVWIFGCHCRWLRIPSWQEELAMRPHLGTTRFLLGEGGGVHLFTELRMGTTDDESYFIYFCLHYLCNISSQQFCCEIWPKLFPLDPDPSWRSGYNLCNPRLRSWYRLHDILQCCGSSWLSPEPPVNNSICNKQFQNCQSIVSLNCQSRISLNFML